MLERGGADRLLHRPLGAEVGHQLAVALVRAEGAHQDEAAHAGVRRGRDEALRAADHDPLEILGLALDDRDEVDDDLAALGCGAEAGRVGDVALDRLAAPGLERLRAVEAADERANVVPARAQCVRNLRADEPGAAGEQDLHAPSSSRKLRQ